MACVITAEEFLKPIYPEFLEISRRNKEIKQDYNGYVTVTSEITMRFLITPKTILIMIISRRLFTNDLSLYNNNEAYFYLDETGEAGDPRYGYDR